MEPKLLLSRKVKSSYGGMNTEWKASCKYGKRLHLGAPEVLDEEVFEQQLTTKLDSLNYTGLI